MIESIIRWSVANRFMVILLSLVLSGVIWLVRHFSR